MVTIMATVTISVMMVMVTVIVMVTVMVWERVGSARDVWSLVMVGLGVQLQAAAESRRR